MWVGKAFPVGKFSRSRHPQGIQGGATDRNRVCSPTSIQTEGASHSSSDSVGTLHCVIESRRAHRRYVAQAALNLVSNRESAHKIAAAGVCIISGRKYRRQVVAGMACLALREVAVVEVEVA